jgi:hypothetical protein
LLHPASIAVNESTTFALDRNRLRSKMSKISKAYKDGQRIGASCKRKRNVISQKSYSTSADMESTWVYDAAAGEFHCTNLERRLFAQMLSVCHTVGEGTSVRVTCQDGGGRSDVGQQTSEEFKLMMSEGT